MMMKAVKVAEIRHLPALLLGADKGDKHED